MAFEFPPLCGGIGDYVGGENDVKIQSLARFAVHEHNKNQNSQLEFGRVVKVKHQCVAGMMYYITIEAVEAGVKNLYEAKVWEKLWMNFTQLTDFKHLREV